ncbi:hypothetical protein ACCO45_004409 [Purpureocillium lilacinum]|uniref:Uncharacterized protein n=1 Tax=Purpureocillium lilacinum TaxID=33203 RepID=A0ACC4E349_PURLI
MALASISRSQASLTRSIDAVRSTVSTKELEVCAADLVRQRFGDDSLLKWRARRDILNVVWPYAQFAAYEGPIPMVACLDRLFGGPDGAQSPRALACGNETSTSLPLDSCRTTIVAASFTSGAPFDLIICPTKEIEAPIVKDTNQVAGSVDTVAKIRQCREALRRQVWPMQVAFPDQLARNAQLANAASEDGDLSARLKDVRPHVEELPPYVAWTAVDGHSWICRHADCSLGWTVRIVYDGFGTPRVQDLLLEGLASGDEDSFAQTRYLVGYKISRCSDDRDASGPAPVLLQHRDVKMERRKLQPARVFLPVPLEEVLERHHCLDRVVVRDFATLWRASGPRRVQTVARILRRELVTKLRRFVSVFLQRPFVNSQQPRGDFEIHRSAFPLTNSRATRSGWSEAPRSTKSWRNDTGAGNVRHGGGRDGEEFRALLIQAILAPVRIAQQMLQCGVELLWLNFERHSVIHHGIVVDQGPWLIRCFKDLPPLIHQQRVKDWRGRMPKPLLDETQRRILVLVKLHIELHHAAQQIEIRLGVQGNDRHRRNARDRSVLHGNAVEGGSVVEGMVYKHMHRYSLLGLYQGNSPWWQMIALQDLRPRQSLPPLGVKISTHGFDHRLGRSGGISDHGEATVAMAYGQEPRSQHRMVALHGHPSCLQALYSNIFVELHGRLNGSAGRTASTGPKSGSLSLICGVTSAENFCSSKEDVVASFFWLGACVILLASFSQVEHSMTSDADTFNPSWRSIEAICTALMLSSPSWKMLVLRATFARVPWIGLLLDAFLRLLSLRNQVSQTQRQVRRERFLVQRTGVWKFQYLAEDVLENVGHRRCCIARYYTHVVVHVHDNRVEIRARNHFADKRDIHVTRVFLQCPDSFIHFSQRLLKQ